MPRALTLHRMLVTPAEREKFEARIRERRAHFARQNCHYWIFEEADLPGAFLEFVEAADRATLTRAHSTSPTSALDPRRVYLEVELS